MRNAHHGPGCICRDCDFDKAVDRQSDTCDALERAFRELDLQLDTGSSTIDDSRSELKSQINFDFDLAVPDASPIQQLRALSCTFAALALQLDLEARRLAQPKAKTHSLTA